MTAALDLMVSAFDEQVDVVAYLYVVAPLSVDITLTPGSSSSPSLVDARESRDSIVGSDVVSWFGLESIERYEPKETFIARLERASSLSEYAKRLLFLINQDEDDAPVSVTAIRRAWDVLNALDPQVGHVRAFPGDDGGVDLQLLLAGEVRLVTAGPDGYFQSRRLDKNTGEVTKSIHYGPAKARDFLRAGGVG